MGLTVLARVQTSWERCMKVNTPILSELLRKEASCLVDVGVAAELGKACKTCLDTSPRQCQWQQATAIYFSTFSTHTAQLHKAESDMKAHAPPPTCL